MITFDEKYWTNRYQAGETQWDAGSITTPLKVYFDGLVDKDMQILLAGGGSGHEAAYLHEQGFREVFLLDFSEVPLKNFQQRYPAFPADHLLQKDFFELDGAFDLIVEQTFFCALHPAQRPAYASQMARLLKPGGRLVGVLFEIPLTAEGPPFGGTREEYLQYFRPYFTIHTLEACYNSIKPRLGKELWIDLIRK